MTTREIRMQARTMVRLAIKLDKLPMLRAANERQLEANPDHPLARQVKKLLTLDTEGK